MLGLLLRAIPAAIGRLIFCELRFFDQDIEQVLIVGLKEHSLMHGCIPGELLLRLLFLSFAVCSQILLTFRVHGIGRDGLLLVAIAVCLDLGPSRLTRLLASLASR